MQSGGLSSADKEGEAFFRCGHRHFLEQKLQIFRNLWCVRMDKGGWANADKGGVNFSQFCADVFYGRSRSIFC